VGIRKSGLEAFSSTWRSLVRVFRCHQAAARPPARAEAAATRPNLSQPEEPSAAASLLPEASDFKRFAISLRKADRFLHPFLLVRFFPEIGCVEGTKEAIKNSLQKFRFLYLLFFESMLWCRYSGWRGGRAYRFWTGSKLRHWPPGTNSQKFVPSFFVRLRPNGGLPCPPPPGAGWVVGWGVRGGGGGWGAGRGRGEIGWWWSLS